MTWRCAGVRPSALAPVPSRRPGVLPRARALLAALSMTAASCSVFTGTEADVPGTLRVGTWGGDAAGVIVEDTAIHVHFNCTFGDFARGALDGDGRFSVAGSYLLTAYPVARGPELPAQLSGVVRGGGGRLTMSVAVNDTVNKRLVALGPVTVFLGRQPNLRPCPICSVPGRRRSITAASP